MPNVIIINGSPRAKKSNSKGYANIFSNYYQGNTHTFEINKSNHNDICNNIEGHSDILFVFPLYADSMPVTLLNFLKNLENSNQKSKPVVHVMINCGFIEPEQNLVCIDMMKLFCKKNGYNFGSVLSIGGGEAILDTPFKGLLKWKIKKLADSIYSKKNTSLSVTMPLTKKMYLKASTNYWIKYGERNGITKAEMETMEIE